MSGPPSECRALTLMATSTSWSPCHLTPPCHLVGRPRTSPTCSTPAATRAWWALVAAARQAMGTVRKHAQVQTHRCPHSVWPQVLVYSVRFLVPLAASITYSAWSDDPCMGERTAFKYHFKTRGSCNDRLTHELHERHSHACYVLLHSALTTTISFLPQFAAEHKLGLSLISARAPEHI